MKPGLVRRLPVVAGGAAIIAMGALTAGCGGNETPSPSSTTTPTSSVAPSPTEKVITPGGPNSFSPTLHAPPAPVPVPGNHHHYEPAN